MKSIVVFIPGIMGSVLELDGKIVWPPTDVLHALLPFQNMTDLMNENLKAIDCLRQYSVKPIYQTLLDDLYKWKFSEDNRTLIIAAYDWRKDISICAKELAKYIEDAIEFHGLDISITLLAHSMGGLISRYYLESIEFKSHRGHKYIQQLITMGTPHHGSGLALSAAVGLEKRVFLSKDQIQLIASDSRYPALYQLLPPPLEPFVWDRTESGILNAVDIYDTTTAKKLGLVLANLDATKRFHSALDLTRRPPHTRYFCFSGTNQKTTTHFLVRILDSGKSIPDKVEEESGGDGTVPTWSSGVAGIQRKFVGGAHGTIFRNFELRSTLATLLGKENYLRGVPKNVEVSLRDEVVESQDLINASIAFPDTIRDFSGVVTIERAKINEETESIVGYSSPLEEFPLEYKGLDLQAISFEFIAPSTPGIYRITLRNALDEEPMGFDQLIVQASA